jgi:hypothetical protein
MRPAVRLFALASRNLSPYSPRHMGLDVSEVLDVATDHVARIEASDFSRNPWNPATAPKLKLSTVLET